MEPLAFVAQVMAAVDKADARGVPLPPLWWIIHRLLSWRALSDRTCVRIGGNTAACDFKAIGLAVNPNDPCRILTGAYFPKTMPHPSLNMYKLPAPLSRSASSATVDGEAPLLFSIGTPENALCCAFAPDDPDVVIAGLEKSVRLFRLSTREPMAALNASLKHNSWSFPLCVEPLDGDELIVANANRGELVVLEVSITKDIFRVARVFKNFLTPRHAIMLPNRTQILVAELYKSELTVCDRQSGEKLRTVQPVVRSELCRHASCPGRSSGLALLPTGHVAHVDEATCRVIDPTTGDIVEQLSPCKDGRRGELRKVFFEPKLGRILLVYHQGLDILEP